MIQIVFDMDGVIFDTEALCQKAWRMVGEERGISIAEIDELLKLCIGSNQQHMTEVLREKLGEDFPVPCFLSEAAEQIQLLANEHLPLKKGAEELLKWLKEQKAAVGLASSTASPIVKKYLEKAGLTEYFQIIIGGDQVIYIRTQVIGKLPEDTGDFPLLFQLQFPDFIVCLDDFRGFDVRGFPGGGFVVHDSV